MPRSQFYDQNSHSVIINGIVMRDFYEGEDVISFEPQGDNIVVTRGLDNNAISFGSPRPGILTLKFKPTSPSLQFLFELSQLAHVGVPILSQALVTTGVDDTLTLFNCAVSDTSFQTGGPTMQARTFTLTASNYALIETGGLIG